MEEIGTSRLEGMGNAVRRKRSLTIRRPRPDPIQKFPEIHNHSSPTPLSDDTSKVSSDEPTGSDINSRRKEFSLNQCILRGSFSREGDLEESGLNHQWHTDGVLASSRSRNTTKVKGMFELHSGTTNINGGRNGDIESFGQSRLNGDGEVKNDKVKKVKLKVAGVTRTFQAASSTHAASGGGSSKKSSLNSDAPRARQKLILQENSDDDFPPDKSNHREISLTDFTRGNNSGCGKAEFSAEKMPERSATGNTSGKADPVRKSKRVPKKRLLSDAFDEEDEDDEIRYLEKLKYSKVAAGRRDNEVESRKKQKVSKNRISEDFVSSKKSGSERGSEETYDEDEAVSDGDPEGRKKKPRSDSIDSPSETKSLTTRQRALLSSKDASSASGASTIEFPNGLPPAPPRKQKEKLTEVEQQLKKAEAAQRRKLQVEKAARESEAEAIRKILGQDSSRKKKEDKIKKRQEELAQEKAANAHTIPSNTVRLVMGPAGTVVTFSNDIGLPSIFDSKTCSYPPPREQCAGPSCCNPYKYRDSKSKLPLCSLQCYKAIHAKMQADEATAS